MRLIGVDLLMPLVAAGGFSAKVIFNPSGAIFFPASQEHRDQKMPGLSYEDEYQGNALAGMLSAGKIEIRGHQDFSAQLVAAVVANLLAQPDLKFMRGWHVTYMGKPLHLPR